MALPHNVLPPIGTNANVDISNPPGMGMGMGVGVGVGMDVKNMMNPTAQDQNQMHNADPQTPTQTSQPRGQGRPPPPPLDTMRAYRACLNCRNRKSKCDLDLNGGRPPCRRCTREAKDCVLGESHRGGRRVRKKPKLEGEGVEETSSSPSITQTASFQSPVLNTPTYSPIPSNNRNQSYQGRYDNRQEPPYTWQPRTNTSASDTTSMSRLTHQTNITSPANEFRSRQESTISVLGPLGERAAIHQGVASTELQNPSDALEILAQVADRADDGDSSNSEPHGNYQHQRNLPVAGQPSMMNKMDDRFDYKPIETGIISSEMVYQHFSSYEQFFHPYFPIIPRETFDRTRLPWLSHHEPYLFSAILTIATKDDERVHQACYDHMQVLIGMITSGADANIDAVEALLLLSQWVSHRSHTSTTVGRGEEDRVAWMYIGNALRLAYFLGIDKVAFQSGAGANEDPAMYNRKRLVWVACYICDRQVSVRVGKGFWSRGPGPLSGLRANDFPTLQPHSQGDDNWAMIFQANLELTQIFSNVHDILYSSKDAGWDEMLQGRYTKYLDDFRYSIRSWNDTWGNLNCSPQLKTSLLITYHYLRLYVNAFAYQATISRALTFKKDSQHQPNRAIPQINATAPDARFIYEAVNAAKSLLLTFNDLVDLGTLRYMPVCYYLFVIYSGVFLYKARLTTTMSDEERMEVRSMIQAAIERLQRASIDKSHMGSRYARLLQLLWHKSPSRERKTEAPLQSLDSQIISPQNQNSSHTQTQFVQFNDMQGHPFPQSQPQPQQPNNGFSWLDLGATWNFATQNNGGSTGSQDDMVDTGLSPFGNNGLMNVLPDYSFMEGENGNFIF